MVIQICYDSLQPLNILPCLPINLQLLSQCFTSLLFSQNVFFLFLSYQSLWKAHQFRFCPHYNWSTRSAMTSPLPNLVVNSHSHLTWPICCKWLTWPSCFQGTDLLLNSLSSTASHPSLLSYLHIYVFPRIHLFVLCLFSLYNHCLDYLIHLMFLNTMFTLMTAFIIL